MTGTPVRYSAVVALIASAAWLSAGVQPAPDAAPLPPAVTTVFLVRHAEKASLPPADPPLSPAGQVRAKQLVHVLAKVRLKAAYTTRTTRTRQTVKPAAAANGLTPIEFSEVGALASEILATHRGHRVLVVGHSDTLQRIAVALGAGAADCVVTGDEFDNLCVVTIVSGGRAHGVNLQYGKASP